MNGGNTNPELKEGHLTFPPKTHDTSRIGWHMKDLECFAESVETAVSSSFPNHGGSRYRSVNVSMMRWAQDNLGVAQELNILANLFQDEYGFNVEEWKIPADKTSHTNLMQKALDFLGDYDSEDNLFILYYAGHGFINQDRQSTWAWRVFLWIRFGVAWLTTIAHRIRVARQSSGHTFKVYSRGPSLMSLFSWTVVLLQVLPRGRDTVMETIAACGFEGRALLPGEHSFTTSLIEVLQDWANAPSFSVTMLHSEVLRVLMRRRKEKCTNGQKLEWRSTPVHMTNFTHARTIGIELCKRSLIDTDSFPSIQSSQPIEDLLQSDIGLTSATYLDLMSLGCDALEERLSINHETREPSAEIIPTSTSASKLSGEVTSTLKLPHMLISITLDEDQPLPNPEACRRWICAFPGLAKHVKIEGIFTSYSTVIILSIPVVIWNMLPDNPACQSISYVTSRNLIVDPGSDFLHSERSLATECRQSQSTMGKNISNTSVTNERVSGFAGPVDLQTPKSIPTPMFESFPRGEIGVSDAYQAKGMTESQRTTVNATLNAAIDRKMHFDSPHAVREYLDGLLSPDLLHCFWSEIIDCWITIQADRSKQLPFPALSSPFDSSLDGGDRSEKSDAVFPAVVLKGPERSIGIICPSVNVTRPILMRNCNGDVSYISEVFARQQLQAGRKSRIIINWSPLNEQVWSYTQCVLVHPDHLPGCVVALAENCGKDDTEDTAEEQEEEGEIPSLGLLAALNIEMYKRLKPLDSKANSKRKAPSLPRNVSGEA